MPDRRTADQNLDPLRALPEHLSLSTADHEVKVPLSFITFLGEGAMFPRLCPGLTHHFSGIGVHGA